MSLLLTGSTLTAVTPAISLHCVTTCDAQLLHISAEISSDTSSSATTTGGADAPVGAGVAHAMTDAIRKRKSAGRTFSLCAGAESERASG